MNEQNYTSEWLSKKLDENGFHKVSKKCWYKGKLVGVECYDSFRHTVHFDDYEEVDVPYVDIDEVAWSYDILNDLCVKYKSEMFGDFDIYYEEYYGSHPFFIGRMACMLRQGKKQEAEEYIWDNCKFNPSNQ